MQLKQKNHKSLSEINGRRNEITKPWKKSERVNGALTRIPVLALIKTSVVSLSFKRQAAI